MLFMAWNSSMSSSTSSRSQILSPTFYFLSFTILHFILIHFILIIYLYDSLWSNQLINWVFVQVFFFFFLAHRYPVAIAPFVGKSILFHWIALTILPKISWPYLYGLSFPSSFLSFHKHQSWLATLRKNIQGVVIPPILLLGLF